jgi:two-component system NarL family sensor kinase
MENQIRTAAFIVLGCGVIFLLILAIVLFVLKHQRRVLKNELAIRDLRNKQQLEIFKATIEAEEKQKEQISRNLHDTISPSLAIVQNQLGNAPLTEPREMRELLENCQVLIKSSIEGLREACYNLTPQTLKHMGLAKAIEHLVYDVRRSKTHSAIFYSRGESHEQPNLAQKQLNVFRIVQELIYNILKHSFSSQFSVEYESSRDFLNIKVLYDGNGIDDNDVERLKNKGLGLSSVLSRSMLIGAELSFSKSSSELNTVLLTVPLVS